MHAVFLLKRNWETTEPEPEERSGGNLIYASSYIVHQCDLNLFYSSQWWKVDILITFIWKNSLQFLKHGSLQDIQLDDLNDFTLTDKAMTAMGMSDNEKLAIYSVVAGVLHLGNIAFEEDHDDKKGEHFFLYSLTCDF